MANRKAKQGNSSQSIVRHPLFPTIVAFWFAALFGLGSLAVRTSLLESLVIASRIDLIVPQTAPPLGITARILIALGMAAIGSILGFVLALRLARPRPEKKQERVRTVGAGTRAASPYAMEYEPEQESRGPEPERRRSLIASNEGHDVTIFDDGPSFLTGLEPHILDVTEFECDPIDEQPAEPERPELQPHSASALDLEQFDTVAAAPGFESMDEREVQAYPSARAFEQRQPEPAVPASAPVEYAAPSQPRAFDAPVQQAVPNAAAPEPLRFSAPVTPVEARTDEQPVADEAPEALDAPMPQAFVAPVTSPLQFSVGNPPIAAAPAPAQPYDVHEPVEAAQFEEPSAAAVEMDHADPLAAFRNTVAPKPIVEDELAAEPAMYGDLASEPQVAADPASEREVAADSDPAEAEAGADPETVKPQLVLPMGAAAEQLMTADLPNLSPVELIERLALSLQRRGRAVTLPSLQAAHSAAAVAPEPVAVEPEATLALSAAVEPEVVAASAALAEAEAAKADANSSLTLPAAMRPIDFAQYEPYEDLPPYVPARSIAMPARATGEARKSAEPEPQPQPAAQFVAPQEAVPATPRFGRPVEEAPAQPEEEVLEAGYSSLLDMSKPAVQRQPFVRVNDPEAETEAAEPVVIFPGQAMRAGTRFAAPSESPVVAPAAPPPSLAEAPAQPRRFDAPAAAVRSPEETERALRSALSTLQRMSGAA